MKPIQTSFKNPPLSFDLFHMFTDSIKGTLMQT